MSTIALQLTELVAQAAQAAGHGDTPIPLEPCVPCADPKHGDYQSNFAFRVGKAARTNPRAVATAFAEAMPPSPMVDAVEVAGPGFLNFRLTDAFLGADLARRTSSERLGAPKPGDGQLMVLDYSSPNIAKRMHVGHLRSTVIGDALYRLQSFVGWDVKGDNHIGDWGTQFGKLIVMWQDHRDEAAYQADPIGELQRIYQLFDQLSKDDATLIERARAETAKLQNREQPNYGLWQQFVAASMAEFNGIYQRFGIEFDVTYGESHYKDDVGPLIARLKADGHAIDDQGAVIVPLQGKGLSKNPLLIQKSDGAALYGTTDLATLQLRQTEWGRAPKVISYVTDTRQQLHFRQVFAAARKAGIVAPDTELVHVWFGMLKFADGAVASTRAGQVVNLVDVLDTARDHARAVVDAKSGDFPEAERAHIAEVLGLAAVRYTDLSQNPTSDIVFDWDKMLADQGNTATYLMYAHARCHGILRKAAAQGLAAGEVVLEHESERDLALLVCRTPEVVLAAAEAWKPNLLCDHLFRLAQGLSRFYGHCKVLSDDNTPQTTASRLMVVTATAHALKTGLGLLGIEALERM